MAEKPQGKIAGAEKVTRSEMVTGWPVTWVGVITHQHGYEVTTLSSQITSQRVWYNEP